MRHNNFKTWIEMFASDHEYFQRRQPSVAPEGRENMKSESSGFDYLFKS